jgi:hypothetical protein
MAVSGARHFRQHVDRGHVQEGAGAEEHRDARRLERVQLKRTISDVNYDVIAELRKYWSGSYGTVSAQIPMSSWDVKLNLARVYVG